MKVKWVWRNPLYKETMPAAGGCVKGGQKYMTIIKYIREIYLNMKYEIINTRNKLGLSCAKLRRSWD